ncbi:receptor-transporting protein 4-like [Bombina bombina]|uniref:receptor-transporting protein 4 n=1 Tax=Bombina bombina TaxID=8345 RepID=UPI00235AFEDE|nr:receptor-transporting protein 4 [Bombina bombina]XP_053565029.1 receptor-transporting protein 4-like [Bombina bombina]
MDHYIWERDFDSQIEELDVPDEWSFSVDNNLLRAQSGYVLYTQHTYGGFCCSSCRRVWNSAEIQILFAVTLKKWQRCGTVKMRIYRQRCKKCKTRIMEQPQISRVNINIVIANLVKMIGKRFYNQDDGKQTKAPVIYSKVKDGPHEKEHCEACQLGICKNPKAQETSVAEVVTAVSAIALIGLGTLAALLSNK